MYGWLIAIWMLPVVLGTYEEDFIILECSGKYDEAMFKRITSICDECHHLYGVDVIYHNCRRYCFSTDDYFRCLKALGYGAQKQDLAQKIHTLAGHY